MKGRVKAKKNMTLHLMRMVIMLSLVAIIMPMMVHGAAGFPRVSVSQLNPSTMPTDVIFTYKLKPNEPNNPMPLGSTEAGFAFTLSGKSVKELVFSENIREGHYIYKLSQVVERERTGVIYDKSSYRIELLVNETKEATLIVFCEEGSKVEEITFENGFKQAVNPPPKDDDPKPVPTPSPTPEKPLVPKGPITGDNTNFVLEIVGIIAALSIFIIVAVARKKSSKKDKELLDL
jgi:hypothetical protein